MQLLFCVYLLISPVPASAADLEDLVAGLAAGGFNDRIAVVEELAATGDARVVPVLQALLDGALHARDGGAVVIAERQGRDILLRAPLTLQEIGPAEKDEIKKIPINNRLRGVLRGALGGLTLLSPNPSARLQAAEAVFRSRSAELLPVLEEALGRERDGTVRAALARALAAITLTQGKDTAARIAAIETLAGHATQDVQALLGGVLLRNADGSFIETEVAVRRAASEALEHIRERLALWGMINNLFQGLSLGSVLLLAAIGLAITFGVMGVINMAHGEMVMLGAYTTFIVQELFRSHLPGALNLSLAVAVPAAFLVAAAFGAAIERGVIRFLYGRPLETLLATWGLSLVLQQAVRTLFGPTNREVSSPSWMSGAAELVGGLALTYNRIWIIVFSLAVLAALMLLLRRTPFGLQVRAVMQNRRMAGSMGIRTGAIDALTFALGSGIAGVAGVALSQIDNVSPNLGQAYIIDSFLVVVFGGVGNLWGTLVGAMTLGVLNKFLEPYAGAVLAKILVLVAIVLFIQKRPRGLFALKGRAVEA